MRVRSIVTPSVLALILAGAPVRGHAEDIPYWPSEQEALLDELDSELIDTQQKLFAARQSDDKEATEALGKTFKECQEKRLNLLRAMGHLPKD